MVAYINCWRPTTSHLCASDFHNKSLLTSPENVILLFFVYISFALSNTVSHQFILFDRLVKKWFVFCFFWFEMKRTIMLYKHLVKFAFLSTNKNQKHFWGTQRENREKWYCLRRIYYSSVYSVQLLFLTMMTFIKRVHTPHALVALSVSVYVLRGMVKGKGGRMGSEAGDDGRKNLENERGWRLYWPLPSRKFLARYYSESEVRELP